jgi:tRNA dimethylallyltransferase
MSNNIKENQIISIVGATATGKTATALKLAEKLIAEKIAQRVFLLSADSRQVYQGLENLTGADLPIDFLVTRSNYFSYPYFENLQKNISLHGSSIIEANKEWSVAHFKKLFTELRKNLNEEDVLIVVGGTGFYQEQILQTAEDIFIPQNENLRKSLEKLSVEELQKKLGSIATKKLSEMNNSDINNPRRLIRAIEVATFKKTNSQKESVAEKNSLPTFYLEMSKDLREEKIKKRVAQRFQTAKEEVKQQLLKNESKNFLAFSSTGFRELEKLLKKQIEEKECLELWQLAEIQYAKRQDTWWKKRSCLIKIDIEKTKTIADKILNTCYI